MDFASLSFWVVGVWGVGLFLLFVAGKILSALTLRSVEKSLADGLATGREESIKRIYRSLINIASGYYYVSLPIVGAIVLLLIVAVFYLFFMVGRIPIKIALFLLIGGAITIYKMVTTMFVKVEETDPGRSLKHAEAPGLWVMTKEVAEDVGTRPIDEIRITPGTDLAVYERGSRREKAMDGAHRILLLGMGILRDFRESEFRSVLAHEYGHFSHRDTAGGEVALRVQNDMYKYFVALYQAGQAVWWNIAVQFLRLYSTLFRRITHGATRLQEILADRVAAQLYGAMAFRNGLTHVIKRSIEFQSSASIEIQKAQSERRPLTNLYDLPLPPQSTVGSQLDAALGAETSEDDTHPSPADRFRFVARFESPVKKLSDRMVLDLFVDREAITREMTLAVAGLIQDEIPADVVPTPPPQTESTEPFQCSECGAKVHPGAKSCQACGIDFDEPAEK